MNKIFSGFSIWTAKATGTSYAFILALSVVIVWALTGPIFNYSDTWQLVINTGTTVVTFLQVFLIQHAQTRDTKALQIKLDELIRVTTKANNALIGVENALGTE